MVCEFVLFMDVAIQVYVYGHARRAGKGGIIGQLFDNLSLRLISVMQ